MWVSNPARAFCPYIYGFAISKVISAQEGIARSQHDFHRTLHCLAGKIKRWFLSPNLPQQLQHVHFFPLPPCGSTTPHTSKKEQNDRHLVCYNHFYLSRWLWWLLLSTNCLISASGEHDIATEPQVTVPVYRVLHFDFVSQKLVQVAVNYLQLDWPAIAPWAYASTFAVAVWFQNKDQFWIPPPKLHEACFFSIFRKTEKTSLQGRFLCFLAILAKKMMVFWYPRHISD